MGTLILTIIGGSAGAACIKLIDNLVMHKLQKKDKDEECKMEKSKCEDEKFGALCSCVKFLTADKIKEVGLKMIDDGSVDFLARQRLNEAHGFYHDLGGNGDFDTLMENVNGLPLKTN